MTTSNGKLLRKHLSLGIFACAFLNTTLALAKAPSLPSKTVAEKKGLENVYEPPVESSSNPPTANSSNSSAVSDPHAVDSSASVASTPLIMQAKESTDNTWELSEQNSRHPRLLFGFGYTHSRWSKFSPAIKNGSIAIDIGFEREWASAVEGGLHINLLSTATNSSNNDNIMAFHIAAQTRILLMPGKMRPFAGIGIALGTYRAWPLASETATTITFSKHGGGAIVGLLPEIGLRFVTGAHGFFDLSAGYTGYLDSPKSNVGGVNFLVRFGLIR